MLRDLVADNDGLFVSTGMAEPATLIDELLSEVLPHREGLRVFQVLTGSEGRLVKGAGARHRLMTPVPGAFAADRHRLDIISMSMRQCAAAMERDSIPVDGALVTAVRRGDDLWLAPATDLAAVAFERARFRAVETVPGWDREPLAPRFSVAEADYLVEGPSVPSFSPSAVPSGVAQRIGTLVAELVPVGAVIEIGVGSALTAVPQCLIEAGRPLAVHGGLVSDWVRELIESGVASVPLECAGGRSAVAAVAAGSDVFHEWLSDTDAVAFADSRHAHDPGHLMSQRPFVAINSAAAVDLGGQMGARRGAGATRASGGLLDFAIAGAYGGLSIIALASTRRDGSSRIVPEAEAVHLPASLVSHVVTEYGVAELRGRSPSACREALLQIAHPDHRDALAESTNA